MSPVFKLTAHEDVAIAPITVHAFPAPAKRLQALLIEDDGDTRLELIAALLSVGVDVCATPVLGEGVAEALDSRERADVVLARWCVGGGLLLPTLELRAEKQPLGEPLPLPPLVIWAPRGLASVSQHIHFLARHESQVLALPVAPNVVAGLALYYAYRSDA
ncbi:MAG TPA: hypothetical protein VIG30_07920 [Ktedonobacterales bacterium]|jgi:hypothetical protein